MTITTEKQTHSREKDDHYPTPIALCKAALRLVPKTLSIHSILDPGCGAGVWGQAAQQVFKRPLWITGVDVREIPKPDGYATFYREDFQQFSCGQPYDLVIGNPPFKHAEAFLRKGMECLRDGGYMVYLLRLAFLGGQKRGVGLWREMPPHQIAICSARPSFTGDGNTDREVYAVYVLRKGYRCADQRFTWLHWR